MKVYISSIEVLEEFLNKYRNFIANLLEIVDGIKLAYFCQYEDMLKKIKLQYQLVQKLRQCNQQENCDCSRELEEAEEKLKRMQSVLYQIEEQWKIYCKTELKIRHLAGELRAKAQMRLGDILEHLREYVTITIPGEQRMSSTDQNKLDVKSQITDGSVSVSNASVTFKQHERIDLSHYILPEGFQWVPLEEIEATEISKTEFRKVDYETMKKGLEKLPEVLERLQDQLKCKACNGKGWIRIISSWQSIERFEVRLEARLNPNSKQPCLQCGGTGIIKKTFHEHSSYFSRLDRQAGRSYEEGLQRVYEAFFGADHIRLSRFKGSQLWGIDNGRHRIQIARDLGWKFIPAKTIEVEKGGGK